MNLDRYLNHEWEQHCRWEEEVEQKMNTVNDFINFLRIFNALRNGSLEERKAVHESKADVEFIVAITEAGLFDRWSALADDIVKGV